MNDAAETPSLLKAALINGSWKDFSMCCIDRDMQLRFSEIDPMDSHFYWSLFRRIFDDWKDAFDAVDLDDKPSWPEFAASVWTLPNVVQETRCHVIRGYCGQRFEVLLKSNFQVVELSETCIQNLFKSIYDEILDLHSTSELECRYRFAAYVSNEPSASKALLMQWVKFELEANAVQALQERCILNPGLHEREFYDLTRGIITETRRLYNAVLFGGFSLADNHHVRSLDDPYLFSLLPRNWNDDPQQILDCLWDIRAASGHRAVYSRTFPLDDKRMIKYSDQGLLEETIAMELVRIKTSVPVPQALMTFVRNGQTFLVMSRLGGEALAGKSDGLSEVELAVISQELAQHVNSIRRLGALLNPSGSDSPPLMGSWFGGPLENIVFDPAPSSAFQSSDDLRYYWEQRLKRHRQIQVPESFNLVLTHGDLNPRNVMVEDGHVVGVVDWDTFGWYPDFWEIMMLTRQAKPSVGQFMTTSFLAELGTTAGAEDLCKAVSEALYYS
ncbi:hypothetical protein D9758_017518 [Tetrapyrgos nigripes]|uniref:Aminoglycoside phosphotransferase domain-containing protein n=1 Tax=Tetrapyrgos nigripes TaxID=182062 RepID=A0A8H5C310_9AGAR|nr:hypothetical protein D9758_017518 [Tetrapyrgos nigripes]